MPSRRRSDSRSPSRTPPRRRERSPPRRRRDDSRSRSRGRSGGGRGGRGGGGRSGGGGGGGNLSEWGTAGVIVDLKGSGFGFIRPDSGKVDDKDLYFHCTAVGKKNPFDELRINDEVTYECVRDERKGIPTAKNVSLKQSRGRKESKSRDRK
ncbi:unnamed protein product, partial [Polarella glacialis]